MNQLFASPAEKAGWRLGLPDEQYHADKTAVSSTALRQFLVTPSHFKGRFIDGKNEEPTDAMKFGTAVHQMVLEPEKFRQQYVVQPSFDRRTTKGKEAHAEWTAENAGRTIITQEELDTLLGISNKLTKDKLVRKLFETGMAETAGYYRDPVTGIRCRIKPDFINPKMGALIDLKTTRDAGYFGFQRSIADFRYDVQIAMYDQGFYEIEGNRPEMCIFLAIEKTPPFEFAIYVADESVMDAITDYRYALDGIKKCIETDDWPGYQRGAQNIGMPVWFMNKKEERNEYRAIQ